MMVRLEPVSVNSAAPGGLAGAPLALAGEEATGFGSGFGNSAAPAKAANRVNAAIAPQATNSNTTTHAALRPMAVNIFLAGSR